jgi:hypothetical protein
VILDRDSEPDFSSNVYSLLLLNSRIFSPRSYKSLDLKRALRATGEGHSVRLDEVEWHLRVALESGT